MGKATSTEYVGVDIREAKQAANSDHTTKVHGQTIGNCCSMLCVFLCRDCVFALRIFGGLKERETCF